MEAYTSFAMVYDELMDNIPYEEWCAYLVERLKKHGIKKEQVIVELGCGTGNITRLLSKKGYRMIGVDVSEEMLMMARQKEDTSDILYIHQDMTQLELNGHVDAMISLCDSMNYLTEEEALYLVFQRVAEYLHEDGVFVFDMKTPYFYREICGDNTFAEDREDVSFIWDNYFDEESSINEYALSLFVPGGERDASLWRKFTEFHYQRAYEIEEVKSAVLQAGLKIHSIYDAFTENPPREDSERLYYVVGR